MVNYLAAESLIVARLKAQVSGIAHHLTAADLAGVREERQHTPATHTLYDGDDLGDRAGDGLAQLIRQRWMVVVAVKNARDTRRGAAARAEAGRHITAVLQALAGWSPGTGLGPLVRIPGPRPAFSPGGYAYFPFTFHTVIDTEAAPGP